MSIKFIFLLISVVWLITILFSMMILLHRKSHIQNDTITNLSVGVAVTYILYYYGVLA
jgi:hypothetical protein